MPKQLIEVDVPEGFEVDTNWDEPVGRYTFNSAMTVMWVDVAIRRKLSYEPAPPRTSVCSNYAFGIDMAAEGTTSRTADSSFGAFATEDCSVVLKLLPHNYRETYALDYWVLPSGARHGTNCDVSMLELRRPHFLLSKGERWPWVDCNYQNSITVSSNTFGFASTNGASPIDGCLPANEITTAYAQQDTNHIESDCSGQFTRLLRHLGIDVPPTAAEVDDLVRCTLNSLRAENWVDLGERLLPQIKEIHLGDGKSVRVSGEIHRDDWQWPEWLKAKWIVQVESGEWLGADTEPVLHQLYGSAYWSASGMRDWQRLARRFIGPPCTDWRQSKRRNPQWKD